MHEMPVETYIPNISTRKQKQGILVVVSWSFLLQQSHHGAQLLPFGILSIHRCCSLAIHALQSLSDYLSFQPLLQKRRSVCIDLT
jgi:hypothetical protein